MSESPSAILRTWFEQVWNAGDEATIDRLYAPTAVANGLPDALVPGPAGFKPFYRNFRAAFPDIHIEVLHAMDDGDIAVAHCRVTGTHTGEGLGVPPTHRSIDINGMTIARVSGGQIQEGWNYYHFIQMYQQLGLPVPAAAEAGRR
jgi:steroid delta-isomerase-like uncharacterized protein